jgi:hypothetical protein
VASAGRILSLAIAALPLGGCASFGVLQTANTVGKGNLEAAAQGAVQAVTGPGGPLVSPHGDVGARYGVTDTLDLGVLAGSSGLDLTAKYQFTNPTQMAFVLSVAPTFGGGVAVGTGGTGGILILDVPLLLGLPIGPNQLVIGVKLQDLLTINRSDVGNIEVNTVYAGASVGFAWRAVWRLIILPELALLEPLFSHNNVASGFTVGASAVFLQFGLGLLVDGPGPSSWGRSSQ